MNLHQVIKSAVNTEKSVASQEQGKYVFIVDGNASKGDIKKAFQEFWGIEVESVRTIKMPKKYRVAGRRVPQVKRLEKKKAIVKIKAGEKFELLKFSDKKSKTVKKTPIKKEDKKEISSNTKKKSLKV